MFVYLEGRNGYHLSLILNVCTNTKKEMQISRRAIDVMVIVFKIKRERDREREQKRERTIGWYNGRKRNILVVL